MSPSGSKRDSVLAPSPWPRLRADEGATGKSKFPGPSNDKVVWTKKVGTSSGDPTVGLDGSIYLPLKSEELVAISSDGSELWKKGLIGHRDVNLRGITTPAVRADGSLIVSAMRKVACLEPDGTTRWEKTIDGLPRAPNISPQGIIYVSAWSIDWAGVYVISPEGESFGQDDPMISDRWSAQRGVTIFPPAIDKDGNTFVAYRSNATHPEAYTWDPPDEVDEDFFYNCVIFDSEGNKIGDFIPKHPRQTGYPLPTSSTLVLNSVSINTDNLVHYLGGGYGDFFIFSLSDILAIKRPKNFAWVHYYTEHSRRRIEIIEKMISACQWTWHYNRDKDSTGKRGPAYGRQTMSYPALADDFGVWVRLTSKGSSSMQPRSSNLLMQFDSSRVKKQKELHWSSFKLPANIGVSPIIDSNGLVYTGCNNGNVYTLDTDGSIIQTIEIGHPIASLAIGLDESLVIVTKNGKICLVQ